MNKIAYVNFKNHPVLGDLNLDFRGKDGQPVDTVIIAGENGVGKSNVINGLYDIISGNSKVECEIGVVINNYLHELKYAKEPRDDYLWVTEKSNRFHTIQGSTQFHDHYGFNAIFSDVDINFHSRSVTNVTSLTLDTDANSRKSSEDLASNVTQLLVDIQALDDAEIATAARRNPQAMVKDLPVNLRMPRFTNAFSYMFNDLPAYDHIENRNEHKEVIFQKDGKQFTLDNLSSGEKQIVFRGCFLLKDINALNGAVVFIDEPEISLHPNWQKKILDYYKRIFTDKNGMQTSQIFAVTHSPFVIHNENRKNDKVIVLARDGKGRIFVEDKPEYYDGGSVVAIKDAFSIDHFNSGKSNVFLEGSTDSRYFNRAIEVYHLDLPFEFRSVGYTDEEGNDRNNGSSSLKNAYKFLVGLKNDVKEFCLFDCDTNETPDNKNNIYKLCMPLQQSLAGFKGGIENSLVITLDDAERKRFYDEKTRTNNDGGTSTIVSLRKNEFCDYICGMDDESLKTVFVHLKEEIECISKLYYKQ